MIALRETIPPTLFPHQRYVRPGGCCPGAEFRVPAEQQQMAVAVQGAEEGRIRCGGGNWVGKSLAYLVPSVLFAVENKRKR